MENFFARLQWVAAALAFPLSAVVVTQNSAGALGIGHVSLATYGWMA
jgi:hypothetical protein